MLKQQTGTELWVDVPGQVHTYDSIRRCYQTTLSDDGGGDGSRAHALDRNTISRIYVWFLRAGLGFGLEEVIYIYNTTQKYHLYDLKRKHGSQRWG